MGIRPTFFFALRDLGVGPALGRGKAPSETEFKRASDAETYREAMPIYRALAAQGHAEAQHELAVIYDFGHDIKPNQARAARLYALAGEAGHADAQFNLGMSYFGGEGVAADVGKAVEWFERAVAQDHPKALNILGVLYRDGAVGAPDPEKAEVYLRRSSELGNPMADLNLGVWLMKRTPGSEEAEALLERAAEAGVVEAAQSLVKLRLKSDDKDVAEKAMADLREDAEANRFVGMSQLGLALAAGELVERDRIEAFAWMCGALAVHVENPHDGKSELIQKLDEIKQEMTEEDIDAGREQVIERHGFNAALILAHIYKRRLFDDPDLEESEAWSWKAIDHGAETRRYIGSGIYTEAG